MGKEEKTEVVNSPGNAGLAEGTCFVVTPPFWVSGSTSHKGRAGDCPGSGPGHTASGGEGLESSHLGAAGLYKSLPSPSLVIPQLSSDQSILTVSLMKKLRPKEIKYLA